VTEVACEISDVVWVIDGARLELGALATEEVVDVEVVDILSLHQNHPGVLQVEVLVVVEVVATSVVEVVLSRHPHHPGLVHVSIRVRVLVEMEELEVVVLELLLL
jgi:hypothetical protein